MEDLLWLVLLCFGDWQFPSAFGLSLGMSLWCAPCLVHRKDRTGWELNLPLKLVPPLPPLGAGGLKLLCDDCC